MDLIYTDGKSVVQMESDELKTQMYVSIVSRRAARLIFRKSKRGEWRIPVATVRPAINIGGGYLIVGLSAALLAIAIKDGR